MTDVLVSPSLWHQQAPGDQGWGLVAKSTGLEMSLWPQGPWSRHAEWAGRVAAGAAWLCGHMGLHLFSTRQAPRGRGHATLTGPLAQHWLKSWTEGRAFSSSLHVRSWRLHCSCGACKAGPPLTCRPRSSEGPVSWAGVFQPEAWGTPPGTELISSWGTPVPRKQQRPPTSNLRSLAGALLEEAGH